jgi:hypothetical protein
MTPRSAAKCQQVRLSSQHGRIRGALLRFLGAATLAVGVYGIAGYFGGPWLVDRWLAQYSNAAPMRTAAREIVRFDPFTLVGEIAGLEMRDARTGAAFAARRVAISFSARSFIERRGMVRSIEIAEPRIEIGSLSELAAAVRAARDGRLGAVEIQRLELTGGAFAAGAAAARTVDLSGLALTLTAFDARSGDPGAFRLEATTAGGGNIAVEGSLAASLRQAQGNLRLGNIALDAVAGWLGGTLAEVDPRGRLELTSAFDVQSLLSEPTLELTEASLAFSDLSLRPAGDMRVTAERLDAGATATVSTNAGTPGISARLEANDARLVIEDEHVAPPQDFAFEDVALLVTVDGEDGLSVVLGGHMLEAGAAAVSVRVPAQTASRRVAIEVADLPASITSVYAADALGRRLAAGTTDLAVDYTLNGTRADGTFRVVAHDLAFAAATTNTPAANDETPSLELAAALLENSDGVIDLELRFAGTAAAVRDTVADMLTARIAAVTQTPFDTLAALVDGAAPSASAVAFLPGDAALNDRARATVTALADALSARPRLGLLIHSGYDPQADRDALARQQIELHVQLATAGPVSQARPAPVDFGSPRARDVLDEFASERLPGERVAQLAARFDCEGALASVCERAYYEQIFDALVANEEIRPTALGRLGRFRAQSIADALRQLGIAPERIEVAGSQDVVETPFGIGLPVELTARDTQP